MNRKFLTALAATAVVLSAGALGAQPALNVSGPGTSFAGATFDVTVTLDADMITDGFSYGVCNDTAFTTHQAGLSLSTLLTTINGGAAPGFESIFEDPSGSGYTYAVVIDLFGQNKLDPGTGYELTTSTLSADAETASTDIMICDTLGTPAVASVIVVAGASIVPTQSNLSVEILGVPDPEFTYIAPNAATVNYPSADGLTGVSVSADFSVAETDNSGLGAPFPNATQGFSMAATNDAALVTPTAVTAIGDLAALGGGGGPAFFTVATEAGAWSVGVVYVIAGTPETIGFSDAGNAVVNVTYEGVAGALMGVEGATSTPINFSDMVGSPPVALVVVVDGASLGATTVDGSLNFNGTTTVAYETGDANGDGIINIADIVSLLSQLFSGAPITCMIALDVNGDGSADAADAVYLAAYIFQGGPPPVAPFGVCETSAGQTPEDCQVAGCVP